MLGWTVWRDEVRWLVSRIKYIQFDALLLLALSRSAPAEKPVASGVDPDQEFGHAIAGPIMQR